MADKDQELYYEEQKRIKAEIERKYGKTTEQIYEEREKRARDAIELKEPDRIPLSINADPSRYTNIQRSAAYYDPIGWKRATRQVTIEFEPDMCNAGLPTSGTALEALGVTNRMWPGGPFPPDYRYQFIEGEYMKEDEYDIFFSDPTDFMIRYFLPRMYRAMQPLSQLPPLGTIMTGFERITTLFATPEFEQVARAISKAGKEIQKFRNTIGDAYEDLAYLGFPPFSQLGAGGIGGAPFDTVSSFLRGMKGSMLDMYRQPENLLKLCDMILDRRIAQAVPPEPSRRGNLIRVGMPLWRGDKIFMSDEQFEKFYWPSLKNIFLAMIEEGLVPMPFAEGRYNKRLKQITDIPKSGVVWYFDQTDMGEAKRVLGNISCIAGNVPSSLMMTGTSKQVKENCRQLIETCAPGGGYILAGGAHIDTGDITNLRVMMEAAYEYGTYKN